MERRRRRIDESTEKLLETICSHARDFYRQGWLMGTSGNFSVSADPDGSADQEAGLWITRSGRHKAELSPRDFVLVDAEGRPRDESSQRPSSDTAIHTYLHGRLAEIGAVYHIHNIDATICSEHDRERGATRIQGIEQLRGFGLPDADVRLEIPILENEPTPEAQAERIEAWIESDKFDSRVPGVNVHRHGLYVWGADPGEARRHVETFAYLYAYLSRLE